MLSSDTFSNIEQMHPSRLAAWLRSFFCLMQAPARRRGNVPEPRAAQELAYLAAAEDHADLERRLAALENKHQRARYRLQTWLG